MGRHYNGDIYGKFWVGVQDSNDAGFFGGTEYEPNHIDYYFSEEDLPRIKDGLEECRQNLGENLEKLEAFFGERDSYADRELAAYLGMREEEAGASSSRIGEILSWYARLLLGKKILECVERTGECSFEAEL